MAAFPVMHPSPTDVTTGAVVALKPATAAKSRLGPLPDALRRRLAWTMAADCLAALAAAVDQLLVVSDEPGLQARLERAGVPAAVVGEPSASQGGAGAEPVGMNGALAAGAEWLVDRGCTLVLACVGDLPALRAESIRRVLAAADGAPRSFLADASRVGTTMLLARRTLLLPHFQGASAEAHRRSGAVALEDDRLGAPVPDARRDVDTVQDLAEAAALGVGPATRALLDPDTGGVARYTMVTVDDRPWRAVGQAGVTAGGHRVRLPPETVSDGVAELRPGQRLHAALVGDRVLSLWR